MIDPVTEILTGVPVQADGKQSQPVPLNAIRRLEASMRDLPDLLDIDALTTHHFCGGLYARELLIPAGATIVGKQHASQNFFVLIQGELSVSTPSGIRRIRAPFMSVTQPGEKRIAYAHEDSICVNFHSNPDDEQDIVKLEARYILPESLPAPEEKELLP